MRRAIVWFRNNLRLYDQPSLDYAVKHFDEVIPVVVLPASMTAGHRLGLDGFGTFRKKFYLEAVENLSKSIADQGGPLIILQGNAPQQLTRFAKELDVHEILASREVGSIEQEEERLLAKANAIRLFDDQFLIGLDELPFPLAELPFGFSTFRKKVEKKWQCRIPLASSAVPWKSLDYPKVNLSIPDTDIDPRSAHPFHGGEAAAKARIHDYLWQTAQIEQYKWTRNQMLGVDFSSKISAFLALGNISPVWVWSEISRYESERKENISSYWLKFELLWREFFRYVALKNGKQIFNSGGIQQGSRRILRDELSISSWKLGQTGDDLVDACMTELVSTGYLSNRGRQNAASYLIHDLGQDWREGASFFEQHLIDYDVASNWGNWMYVAGVGNDRRQHKFDTKWQADKYDQNRAYRNTWRKG